MKILNLTHAFPDQYRFNKYGNVTNFAEKTLASLYEKPSDVPVEVLSDENIRENLIIQSRPKVHQIRKTSKIKEGNKVNIWGLLPNKKKYKIAEGVEILRKDILRLDWSNDGKGRFKCELFINEKSIGEARWSGGVMVYIDDEVLRFVKNEGYAVSGLFFEVYDISSEYEVLYWNIDINYDKK